MANRLKRFRVEAEMTQVEVAHAVGISQPQYQRWESGQIPVPAPKLKKLASVFKTTEAALMGRHDPIEATAYDDTVPDDARYYGEVAFHFAGGGDPLLLSISESSFQDAHRDLQNSAPFVKVTSLANQTVIVRRAAISDVYFSSEAHDTFGPEHGEYVESCPIHLPDTRDWEIIEALMDDLGDEDFDLQSVERIDKLITPTSDDEFAKLVDIGRFDQVGVEKAKAEESRKLDIIHENATKVIYRFSSGKKRSVYLYDDDDLYQAMSEFCTDEDLCSESDQPLVRFPAEGYHRTIFINTETIDYISAPTHRWEKGRTEVEGEILDS